MPKIPADKDIQEVIFQCYQAHRENKQEYETAIRETAHKRLPDNPIIQQSFVDLALQVYDRARSENI